jgi:curved DNA-binding protein CbpA
VSLERIEITPFAVIVGDILQHRLTGNLTIIRPPVRKVLYWSQGELVLITSAAPEDSLGELLVRRGAITPDRAFQMLTEDPTDVVAKFHEAGLLDLSQRQTLLREWTAQQFLPLFSLDEGTAAFNDEEALEPEKRVFLQSTPALVLEGVRAITNGLVLRRSLGDLKREIVHARESRFDLDSIPLTDGERRIVGALNQPETIEAFLKHFAAESVTAARVVISMISLGVFEMVDYSKRQEPAIGNFDDMQRDLELLAAIGSNDQRSLRAVALSRQLAALDHYQLLDVPRAAPRQLIISSADHLKRQYDPATYPPIVREAVQAIHKRVDEALALLKDPAQRASYDKMLTQHGSRDAGSSLQQRITQRSIADQNYARARQLASDNDFYGAIVLLKQAVQYSPDNAQAWYLLGSCQERNPKWRREAAESFQKALAIDPENTDILVSLGDLYKIEGMISRAQTCYEDVLRVIPDHAEAKSRLANLKKK